MRPWNESEVNAGIGGVVGGGCYLEHVLYDEIGLSDHTEQGHVSPGKQRELTEIILLYQGQHEPNKPCTQNSQYSHIAVPRYPWCTWRKISACDTWPGVGGSPPCWLQLQTAPPGSRRRKSSLKWQESTRKEIWTRAGCPSCRLRSQCWWSQRNTEQNTALLYCIDDSELSPYLDLHQEGGQHECQRAAVDDKNKAAYH